MKRFYDNFGNFVGFSRLPIGAISFYQALQRKIFGRYPELPWILFPAINALDHVCQKHWRVVEIGGGMSTLWLSQRCGQVTTFEGFESWFKKLSELLSTRNITNVHLIHEPSGDRMSDFVGIENESLDLLFIDGGPRAVCLERGFPKVRPAGWIYLDNWDVPAFWAGSSELLATKSDDLASSTLFTDYVPGSWCVNTGLLLQKRD